MAELAYTVWVKNGAFEDVSFGPDDTDIPGWALKQMGDHCFVDGQRSATTLDREGAAAYDAATAADLKAEIDKRNDGRDPAWKITKTGSKVDLVAALQADDHLAAGEYDELHVDQLKAEIERRNADRADDAKIAAAGNKGDLVAALAADDDNGG